MSPGIIERKYWNTNGMGIAIVAVRGMNNDVAAYIGACAEGAERQEAAEEWTMLRGSKLGKEEAFDMLPRLKDRMTELKLHYRD